MSIFAKNNFMSIRLYFFTLLFSTVLIACNNTKEEPVKEEVITATNKNIFGGEIIFSSTIITDDSVLAASLNTFSPGRVDIYLDSIHFRMIEYGGTSHGNVIINKQTKEVWQLDTTKKIAHLGEYSDLGDPSGVLKSTMPDHYAPTVELLNETATIAGHICDKYRIVRSGFIPENDKAFIWVARDIKFPSSRYDIQTEVNRSAVPIPLYLGYEDGAVLKLMVQSKNYSRTFEVTELKENYFPIGIFEIPENYQRK